MEKKYDNSFYQSGNIIYAADFFGAFYGKASDRGTAAVRACNNYTYIKYCNASGRRYKPAAADGDNTYSDLGEP